MPSLLERYIKGEHREVWNELRSLTEMTDGERDEAWLVATETMKRVARNAERIANRLETVGWKSLTGSLISPAGDKDRQIIQRIEELTGAPLPISLHAFWLNVGGIDFVWDYDSESSVPELVGELEMDDMDPLCVHPAQSMEFEIEELEDQDVSLEEPYRIPLAPDYAHKINVSGGEPYGIDVPFCGVDPIFDDDRHALPFVDYLRLCFRFAGFPSLERNAERSDLPKFLEEWTKDLEEF
jgi:hypothetical protein